MAKALTPFECSTRFYDLFFAEKPDWPLRDYMDNSFCDEMVEVDLNTGAYALLFDIKNKYYSPTAAGSFDELYRFARDYVVHPEDVKIFEGLMNPEGLIDRLNRAEHPGFAFAHFRYRLQDGRYRYVEQAILSGPAYGFAPGVFRFYIYDIQNVVTRCLGERFVDNDIIELDRDDVTGLYLTKAFFAKAQTMIDAHGTPRLCLFSLDIDHFRLFDEWYGHEQGDYLLTRIGALFSDYVRDNGGLAGYFGADDFAYVGSYDRKSIHALCEKIKDLTLSFGGGIGFFPAIGVYLIQRGDHLKDAFERAGAAAEVAKKDLKVRVHLFDPELQKRSEDEFRLLIDFMEALKNDEITFYLQPQCRISSKRIVGVEALVRWIKKDGTVVSPGVFVPILESHGFIAELDRYVFDKVCASLKDWLDEGHVAVPCSINVSRVDILTFDVAGYLAELVAKYDIPIHLLKIEITESAYVGDNKETVAFVEKLHELGFTVLMDDFGSGYSSLNTLSSLNVDVIKLDGAFLAGVNDKTKGTRGMQIVESIVNMAKVLSLPIIVEGVETEEQVEYLESLGCRYVQGYYFYKPMSVDAFRALIDDGSMIDDRGFVAKRNEQFRLREFLDSNIYSDSMLNNVLGPVALYVYDGKKVDIVRYNEQFYKAVHTPVFMERLNNIERFVPEEDIPILHGLLDEAKENRLNGSNGYVRFSKEDGSMTTFHMHFYYLTEEAEGSRFYGSVRDVTEIADLRESMSIISAFVSESIVFAKKFEGQWTFRVVAHGLTDVLGFDKEEFQKELDDGTFWSRIKSKSAEKITAFADAALASGQGFAIDFEMKGVHGKTVQLSLTADSAKGKANNVDFVILLRRKKRTKSK